ncbi:tRNA-splicing endonuclease subunit Sen34 [Cololabis saira]|uniref:tRNA-splicing endonuclease subunit Sen34 n=1 Tax=Cololabis saira TaxID=129043 RepID=UPI002AD3588F|nr:tRNA-splicing endonuclease subunit Sen34 [Cololabis saira]
MEAPPRGEEHRQEAEQQTEAPPPAVAVSRCGSAPLLWRVPDLKAVRSRGLVGALLGSLPRSPRQNLRLGRPLLLLPEEEELLREGAGPAAPAPPPHRQGGGAEPGQRYQEEQRRSYEEQRVLALEDRRLALTRALTSRETGESVTVETDPEARLEARLEALDRDFQFPPSALAVQLSTARAGLSCCPETRLFLRAERPIRGRDAPGSRYQVFRDLRGRGFFLTSAGKFGGDFLVYPGDPLRFHAHFIALVLDPDQPVPLLDLLAEARLGSNVKKTVLLCSPAPDGTVQYTSLQWSGMV